MKNIKGNFANLKLLKCYESVFDKDELKNNYGFIIHIVIYILLFVFMFILGISEVTYEENNMPNNSTIREHHTDTYYKFE